MDETATARGETAGDVVSGPRVLASLERGATIGRFVVLEQIGAGGMGVVFAAYDPELDRRIALKILSHRAGDERARQRLQREAQAMARLAHPNVVTIFDVGLIEEQVYVAMEFVDGTTLRGWLATQAPWRDVVEIFVAAGRGLAAAHAAGVVHRDFKPDNALVGKDGRVRVVDFGLASTASRGLESAAPALRSGLISSDLIRGLTIDGSVLGTPAYMAPEQHDGAEVDARADQFAFCVALYEGLYGDRPFVADSYPTLVAAVKEGRVQDAPRGSKVPSWLRAIVLRGLRPQPAERHPSMEALLRALKRDPARTRRRAIAIAGGVALTAFAVSAQLGARSADAICSGARDRMVGVWDPAARARVSTALLATGKPYAQDMLVRTGAALDRYADGWVSMHTDACRATRVRGEQSESLLDLRVACLERRRGALKAFVEVLAAGDPPALERAVRAAADLEPLDGCANLDALRVAVAPPRDPAVLASVRELDAQLDRLWALRTVGTYKPTVDEAVAVAASADAIGYAPLRARAHLLAGELFHMLADKDAAEAHLHDASRFAAEAHHDALQASALVVLAEVEISRNGRYLHGLVIARVAESIGIRLGDEVITANARLAAAWALRHVSRFDEAEAMVRAAREVLERRVSDAPSRLILALTRSGIAAAELGRHDEALALHRRALDTAVAAFGAEYPGLWNQYLELGNVAADQGRFTEGIGYVEKARDHLARSRRVDVDFAVPLNNLGYQYAELGDVDRAVENFERALALREKAFGAKHPMGASTLAQLADLRRRQGRHGEAREMLERSLAVTVATRGPETGTAAMTTSFLGYLARQQGDLAAARAQHQRALAIRTKVNGTSHPDYAHVLVDLAAVEVDAGRCDEALRLVEQAQPAIDKLPGPHYQRAAALVVRGRCALSQGRVADAIPALERALVLLENADMRPRVLGPVRWYLARALWASTPDRARADAARAEGELSGAGVEHAAVLAELRAWRRAHP